MFYKKKKIEVKDILLSVLLHYSFYLFTLVPLLHLENNDTVLRRV